LLRESLLLGKGDDRSIDRSIPISDDDDARKERGSECLIVVASKEYLFGGTVLTMWSQRVLEVSKLGTVTDPPKFFESPKPRWGAMPKIPSVSGIWRP
jgi:hypothetical protein